MIGGVGLTGVGALGVVLAGGRGRRMGGAKATALLAGRPLIAWPLDALAVAGLDAVVVAKPGTSLPDLSVPVWREPETPAHPLLGLVAALERARGPIVAVGCDMPFLAPGLLRALAVHSAPVVAPCVAGRPAPFPARYDPLALPALRAGLAREAPVRATLASLEPVLLSEAALRKWGDPARLVTSVNDAAQLAAAAAVLGY
jgi:molybdopterin-guanine dinucleotide biosynthesis protein A